MKKLCIVSFRKLEGTEKIKDGDVWVANSGDPNTLLKDNVEINSITISRMPSVYFGKPITEFLGKKAFNGNVWRTEA